MTQYAEMIAHSCQSVHVHGVGWPEYVEPKTKVRLFDRHGPFSLRNLIIGVVDRLSPCTSDDICRELGSGQSSTINRLTQIHRDGLVKIKRVNQPGKRWRNLYIKKGRKCQKLPATT